MTRRIINDSIGNYTRSHRCQAVDNRREPTQHIHRLATVATVTALRLHRLATVATADCFDLDVVCCTYSTNPIFVEQDNLFDEAFLGTGRLIRKPTLRSGNLKWRDGVLKKNPTERYSATREGRKQDPSIQLFLSQIDGKKVITAKFVKPDSEKASPDAAAAAAMYLTFAMDRCEGGNFKCEPSRRLACRASKKDPLILKHEWIARTNNKEKRDLRLTAPTAELRAFVPEHYDKREAWMPVVFKKIR